MTASLYLLRAPRSLADYETEIADKVAALEHRLASADIALKRAEEYRDRIARELEAMRRRGDQIWEARHG